MQEGGISGSGARRWLLAVVALAALVAVLGPAAMRHGERPFAESREVAGAERGRPAAIVAGVAAEGPGEVPEPTVEAAPRVGDVPDGLAPLGAPPRPPAGHTFVEFHGEMTTAALVEGEIKVGDPESARPEWLGGPGAITALTEQAAALERDWIFGWVGLAADASRADLARALRSTGAVLVGGAGRWLRARLPGDAAGLRTVAALSEVDGLGAPSPAAKLRPVAPEAARRPHARLPVFVTLMDADPDGRWRRELEELGAEVGRLHPAIRVYEATATAAVLEAVAATDYVAAVEPVGTVEAAHDTAVPAMGADALRAYAGPGLFSGVGGAGVPVGVMDTGLNLNHLDIATHRDSICGANFVYQDSLVDDEDLWWDANGHGTHVTGTILGNGAMEPGYAGMAPLVRHVRFAKVLNHWGSGRDTFILRGMDYLAGESTCPEASRSDAAAKPLIVNMSLAATARTWAGREVRQRKLDAVVWDRRQLYVVANDNSNVHGFANYAAAKNSLAVGAVLDDGSLAGFSSHGPTWDGRLAPQVVGVGVGVNSAAGDGSRGGYKILSGTSMASPAVAGVAALLLDAVPAHRERPALARARLMASAIRPDAWLADAAAFPSDNTNGPGALQVRYGLGKASARTSVLNRDRRDGWRGGSALSRLADGRYAHRDIRVPEGASRLDLVLTWDEPPADTVSDAVLNDLDLWLDHGADCGGGACGEHASTSRRDNVEWIIVRDPAPGTYRAKVAAQRVYTAPPRAALAWTIIRGASTPRLALAVDRERVEVGAWDQAAEVAVTLRANAYVAAGTRLHVDCRTSAGVPCSGLAASVPATREDDIPQQVAPHFGSPIELGELAAGETWTARLAFRHLAPRGVGAVRLYFKANAWNAHAGAASVLVRNSGASTTPELPEEAPPANDRFANAAALDGATGSAALDLLAARAEPGEPAFHAHYGRPSGSAWHAWTAPADGLASFAVTTDGAPGVEPRIHVYFGDHLASLREVAAGEWGAQFFATAGEVYRVRVSHLRRTAPMTLKWAPGPRPDNDDLADAATLAGDAGSVSGSNAGATLESGELFGDLAATVWYRWTAPADGAWEFSSSATHLRVLAFAGKSHRNLRLVSGFAAREAVFPARGGAAYWVAVAATNAHSAAGPFELSWEGVERKAGNDDFGGATDIPGTAAAQRVGIDQHSTVEPGEPAASGIRTKWWTWTAPANGNRTWRIEELTRPTGDVGNRLLVTVFEGDALGELRRVATNGPRMVAEFGFEAVAGRRYRLAVGLPAADPWAYTNWLHRTPHATLAWGRAPDNDTVTRAGVIVGTTGSVAGDNAFATAASGERRDVLGRSTLWWTYEAPADGWMRFSAGGAGGPWAVTVHRGSADEGLEMLANDRWQRTANEVLFEARAGVRYTISLGVRGNGRGGAFELRWEEADAPGWLRLAGRVADGQRNSRGEPVALRDPGALAMRDDGGALYLASRLGVQVFERDPDTGLLDQLQLIETDADLSDAALLWDAPRNRLLADDCATWLAFDAASGRSGRLERPDVLTVAGGNPSCHGDRTLLAGPAGGHLYRVAAGRNEISHFAVDAGGGLRFVGSVEARAGVLTNGGEHLYALTAEQLVVFARDAATGELAATGFAAPLGVTCCGRRAMAVTDDDAHLFVLERSGEVVGLFSLDDPLQPARLASFSGFPEATITPYLSCGFAAVRRGAVAIDAVCPSLVAAVARDTATGALDLTDHARGGEADRFNGAVPDFGRATGFAASPDGRHLYLSTPRSGVVIFVRD